MKHLKLYDKFSDKFSSKDNFGYDFIDTNTNLIEDTISKLSNPEYVQKLENLNTSFDSTDIKVKLSKKTFLYYPKTYILDIQKTF